MHFFVLSHIISLFYGKCDTVSFRTKGKFYKMVSDPKRLQTSRTSTNICPAIISEVSDLFLVIFCILFVEANSPSNPEEHSNQWKDSKLTFSTRPTIFWTPSLGCTHGKLPWWPVIPQKFPAPRSGSTYARCFLCPEEWAARIRCTMDQQGFRILTSIF